MRPHRILVAGHDLKFFRLLREALEETELFEFREDVWSGHNSHDESRSRELLDWAEIIVAEWCLGNAVWYSRHKRKGQRLVTRFHLQERETEYPRQLNMGAIDRIAFVGPHIQHEGQSRLGIPAAKTCLIPNIVDVDGFDLPKLPGSMFNLGMIGIAPRRKRFDLALDLLEVLRRRDSRYTLHIKGAHPTDIDWLWARTSERHFYVEQLARLNQSPLRNAVVFDPPGPDVPHWLRLVGFVLSPSDFESFHMAIAEGMAAGSFPVTWSWEGASEIYGSDNLVSDVAEAAAHIESIQLEDRLEERARRGREYVRTRFGREAVRQQWLDILLPGRKPRAPTITRNDRCVRSEGRKRPLLVVHAIDNWATFHRREMLAAMSARARDDVDVLVIEPGNHFATVAKRGWESRETLERLGRGEPERLEENLWRFRSLTCGFPSDVAAPPDLAGARAHPEQLILRRRIASMFPGRARLLHWIYKPDQPRRWLDVGDTYVYECYDDYTRDFASGELLPDVAEQERATLLDAAASFFTSEPLRATKGHLTRRPVIVGNGVSYELFATCRDRVTPDPATLSVGYLGNMARFFDWETIASVSLSLPEAQFWFHGPIELAEEHPEYRWYLQMRGQSNCHFTGRVSRSEGAERIAGYTVLAIPFVQNQAMDAVNPLKLWEYFAVGRPVVATPMKAIAGMNGLVHFAASVQAWRDAILAAASEKDSSLRQRRIDEAEKRSWGRLAHTYVAAIRDVIAEM
ncbi:glycosyltransferase family 4 protein [Myxococcota bacterium]